MRVVIHPADQGGCGHYRMIWPGQALADQGADVVINDQYQYPIAFVDTIAGRQPLGLVGDIAAFNRSVAAMAGELSLARKRGSSSQDLARINDTYQQELLELVRQTGRQAVDGDVVVMQRVVSKDRFDQLRAIQQQGVAVVVEIDDDLHAIHRRNPAWKSMNPLTDPLVNRDWLARACEIADLVTCTTPALAARYGAHGRVAVIPNYVPARYLTIERPHHDGTNVGWSGSIATHPGDLEVTQGGVAHAIHETGSTLVIIGTGVGVHDALRYAGPAAATDWLPIDQYAEAIATLDVGIVPLASNQFNQAKSWLKGLEMASVGVPFVASPTGPYVEFQRAGFGFIADDVHTWRWQVADLARNIELRTSLSNEYRDRIGQGWTIEQNTSRWWDAWTVARDNAARRHHG